MGRQTLARLRASLEFYLPAVIVMLYVPFLLRNHGGFLGNLAVGAFIGLLLVVVGLFGYGLCYAVVSWVVGDPVPAERLWDDIFARPRRATAGILLAAGMWMWWQSNKQSVREDVVRCVQEARGELDPDNPSEVVSSCFEGAGDRFSDWDSDY